MALGGALGLGLGARDAAAFCVAGVAQTHIYCRFARQAWHKLTSTVVLRGRHGTNWHLPSFCVAGVVQMALGGALGLGLGARDAAAFCVAGVAQTHIYCRFAGQAWHKLTSTVVLRGRRGTDGTGWRAWPWLRRPWRRGILRAVSHNLLTNNLLYIHTYIHPSIHTYIPIFSHTFLLCHTPSFTFHFVTHNCFNFSILHHILCLSFLPRPRYNLWSSLLEEVDLWGYPVL